MGRTWAIIERELRRFRRSPVLIAISMVMPIVQLVILGYAFGGNVKHLKVAIVDQDHGVPAIRVRELASAAASGAHTIDTVEYADEQQAMGDLRVALIEDNTDNFVAVALAGTMNGLVSAYGQPPQAPRVSAQPTLEV